MSKLLTGLAVGTAMWLTLTAKPAIPLEYPAWPKEWGFGAKMAELVRIGAIKPSRRWVELRHGDVVIVFE